MAMLWSLVRGETGQNSRPLGGIQVAEQSQVHNILVDVTSCGKCLQAKRCNVRSRSDILIGHADRMCSPALRRLFPSYLNFLAPMDHRTIG
jgi:hypothetical protein